jgi:hypothetical protein
MIEHQQRMGAVLRTRASILRLSPATGGAVLVNLEAEVDVRGAVGESAYLLALEHLPVHVLPITEQLQRVAAWNEVELEPMIVKVDRRDSAPFPSDRRHTVCGDAALRTRAVAIPPDLTGRNAQLDRTPYQRGAICWANGRRAVRAEHGRERAADRKQDKHDPDRPSHLPAVYGQLRVRFSSDRNSAGARSVARPPGRIEFEQQVAWVDVTAGRAARSVDGRYEPKGDVEGACWSGSRRAARGWRNRSGVGAQQCSSRTRARAPSL